MDGMSFDKPSYAPGDLITATVVLHSQTQTVTANYSANPLVLGQLSGTFIVKAILGALSDSGSRSWTNVSYDGVTAVFTARA